VKCENHKLFFRKARLPRDARVPIFSLLTLASRPETKAVEKLNIAAIGVSNWYLDPIHFNLGYFPLDTTFRADSEPIPFPEGNTGYIGTTTQYPDDKQFPIKALEKLKPTTLCFGLRPAIKLTLYIRLNLIRLNGLAAGRRRL
jgi:hypothetical protein